MKAMIEMATDCSLKKLKEGRDNRMTTSVHWGKKLNSKFCILPRYPLKWGLNKHMSDKHSLKKKYHQQTRTAQGISSDTEKIWIYTKEWSALKMLNVWGNVKATFFS